MNIPVKIPTNPGTKEPEDEFILEFMDEDFTETPKSSHDIEIIDIELQQQNNDEVEQGAVTQEPTSLNVLVHVADQMGGEPGIKGTLEFHKEFCTTTPKLSHDTEIIEVEPQQQGNDGVE